jgi:hypothetical protein
VNLVDFVRVRLLTEQDDAFRARHKASRVWADFLGHTPKREAEAELRANIAGANLRIWEQCAAALALTDNPVDERTQRAFNAGAGVLAWKTLKELAQPYRSHPDCQKEWLV